MGIPLHGVGRLGRYEEPKIIFYYLILWALLASIARILATAQLGSGASEIGGGTLTIQGFTAYEEL